MTKLSDTEYAELTAFLDFFSEHFLDMEGLPPHQRPAAALRALESQAPAKARDGLRMAINDCLEMSNRWKSDRIHKADAELRQNGIVTLSALRKRYSRDYGRVVKRGRIDSEVEYYLTKGIAEDGAADLTDNEHRLLEEMLQHYAKQAS